MTREKIVAAVSARFVCIIDESKLTARLGAFPLPLEVIPMARRHVAEQMQKLGGQAVLRQGFTTGTTGTGSWTFSASTYATRWGWNRRSTRSRAWSPGLFVRRLADVLLVADEAGVREI